MIVEKFGYADVFADRLGIDPGAAQERVVAFHADNLGGVDEPLKFEKI